MECVKPVLLFALTIALIGFDAIALLAVVVVLSARLQNQIQRRAPFLAVGLCWVLRVPIGGQLGAFVNAIHDRYVGGLQEFQPTETHRAWFAQYGDRAVGYLERIVDRQINKARGILTFVVILIAVNGLLVSDVHSLSKVRPHLLMMKNLEHYIIGGLYISALLMLEFLWVRWGDPENYAMFTKEITESVKVIRKRSVIMNLTLWVLSLCIIGMVLIALLAPPNVRLFGPR
jgi:hypothetical protein